MAKGSRIARRETGAKKKKPLKKGWIIAIVAGVLLLAAALVFLGVTYHKFHTAHQEVYDDGTLHFETEQEQRDYWDELDMRIIKGQDADVETQQQEIEETMAEEGIQITVTQPPVNPIPDLEIKHDDNIMNILLIGTDERTEGFSTFARGDSCIILSLNKSTGQAKLVSLERGMGVPILAGQYKGQWDWLTHTFCYGGADLMMKEVRECFRVDVDRYIRVNFGSFRAGINAIGGVKIELTQAEADYLNNVTHQDGKYTAGVNRLYGYAALQYARARKIDSDWVRIRRQRTVIQAAINKTRHLSPAKFNSLLGELRNIVRTNLTEAEIMELMNLSGKFQGVTFEQMTIPVSGTYGGMRGMGGRSLYAVDFTANAKILQEFLYG